MAWSDRGVVAHRSPHVQRATRSAVAKGVYVRHLSRELARLGHRVESLGAQRRTPCSTRARSWRALAHRAAQPRPVPQPPDPFARRSATSTATGSTRWKSGRCGPADSEPLTPSRCAPAAICAPGAARFDVVHDNQTLGYGLLGGSRRPGRAPRHHHPPPHHGGPAAELDAAESWQQRMSKRRWYAFTRMQKRVARRLPSVLTRLRHLARRDRRPPRSAPGPDQRRPRRRRHAISSRRIPPWRRCPAGS